GPTRLTGGLSCSSLATLPTSKHRCAESPSTPTREEEQAVFEQPSFSRLPRGLRSRASKRFSKLLGSGRHHVREEGPELFRTHGAGPGDRMSASPMLPRRGVLSPRCSPASHMS